jgi:transposase-like protein
MSDRSNSYPLELRERAVRMVFGSEQITELAHRGTYRSQTASASSRVCSQKRPLGDGRLRSWVRRRRRGGRSAS